MIIYIHGFGGSGKGVKATIFKNSPFFSPNIITPSLSYVPDLAIATLTDIIETMLDSSDPDLNTIGLVGSSLGGYYALYLAEKYGLKAVLLNPSMHPVETLGNWTGDARNYYDESSFKWYTSHLEMLKKFEVTTVTHPENIFLLLEKGDETLDYRKALAKLPNVRTIVKEGGTHSFDSIETLLPDIAEFFNLPTA